MTSNSKDLILPNESKYLQFMPKYDVVFIFQNPKSKNWRKVKSIIKATSTSFNVDDKDKEYFACYNISDSLDSIKAIHFLVYGWKSTFLFVKGCKTYLISHYYRWLDCYLNSFLSENPEYCIVHKKDPIYDFDMWKSHPNRIKSPCKSCWWRGEPNNPASYKDQFYDSAISRGYTNCPRFDIGSFEDRTKRIKGRFYNIIKGSLTINLNSIIESSKKGDKK